MGFLYRGTQIAVHLDQVTGAAIKPINSGVSLTIYTCIGPIITTFTKYEEAQEEFDNFYDAWKEYLDE